MSHFTVCVIGDNIEGQLEPYDENTSVEPYKERISLAQKRNADGTPQVYPPRSDHAGQPAYEWPVCVAVEDGADPTDPHAVIAAYTARYGVDDDDRYEVDDDGLFRWSTYNPQSKWDWYQVGGRWAGAFLLKEGAEGVRGEKSLLDDDDPYTERPGTWVDSARKGDVDWVGMALHRAAEAEATWAEAQQYPENERDIRFGIRNGETREMFIARRARWQPYAALAEGKWREAGKMGGFGMSHATDEDRQDFTAWWADFFEKMPDNVRLTIVDCHI